MSRNKDVSLSKLLSLALRHDPDALGLELDAHGYASVDDVLAGLARRGHVLSGQELERLVTINDKQRFAFNGDGTLIRASQGHSIEVDLGYEPAQPPAVLYHGTATRFLEAIVEKGLIKMSRQHVHLSATEDVAVTVGKRHGKAVVIEVDAARMHGEGMAFYISQNGVWLTDHVPPSYLRVRD
jgi:putative RNA 2'-phosphotransferase